FARTAVKNGINGDLDGVLVGDEVDDLERVLNNSHGLQLLSVVASVHHKGVGESLDDWALGLAEALDGISSGGMWEVDLLELNVVAGVLSEFRSQFIDFSNFPPRTSKTYPWWHQHPHRTTC